MTTKLNTRNRRFAVYALVAVASLTVAGVDGIDPSATAEWVDRAAKLSGAISGILAMLNMKDDPKPPESPPGE